MEVSKLMLYKFGEKKKLNCRAHYISLLIAEIENCARIFSKKMIFLARLVDDI
jgi:hypothetical protein